MELDQNTINRIKGISWFDMCGKEYDKNVNMRFYLVNNWEEAERFYLEPIWEDTTLDARNELTSFLHDRYNSKYDSWNELAEKASVFLNKDILPCILNFKENNNLDDVFVDCVKWDLLGALMESSYKKCRPPIFFSMLLDIYESGHFPCGWIGEWPDGEIVIY